MKAGISLVRWGESAGRPVYLYTLWNERGSLARITNYGGTLTQLHIPDRRGTMGDVVLGFDSLAGYLSDQPYLGAIVGRVSNRIAGGRFELAGENHVLATNDGSNHLHGGARGFDKRVWRPRRTTWLGSPALALSYVSVDGEEGYPGTLRVHAVYALTGDDTLLFEVSATTDRLTPVSITNHSYWNLGGHASGDVLDHTLTLMSDRYTPTDDALVPTGAICPVDGTAFDFRQAGRAIGAAMAGQSAPFSWGPGYDANYVVTGEAGRMRPVARVHHEASGRTLEVASTQPAVQFYSGNFLDGSLVGKGGAAYRKYGGLALEPQSYPNAVNTPQFPSTLLEPVAEYRHLTTYKFYAR